MSPRGRPRTPAPQRRETISLRLSPHAIAHYRAEAERLTVLAPDRGRAVGYTEVIRELLERVAREG